MNLRSNAPRQGTDAIKHKCLFYAFTASASKELCWPQGDQRAGGRPGGTGAAASIVRELEGSFQFYIQSGRVFLDSGPLLGNTPGHKDADSSLSISSPFSTRATRVVLCQPYSLPHTSFPSPLLTPAPANPSGSEQAINPSSINPRIYLGEYQLGCLNKVHATAARRSRSRGGLDSERKRWEARSLQETGSGFRDSSSVGFHGLPEEWPCSL